jgi:hypothetical protein
LPGTVAEESVPDAEGMLVATQLAMPYELPA